MAATCRRLGFQLEPGTRVDRLSVGGQQKVEIVKALHRGATTLVLDEPTAVLTPQEADELFLVMRTLAAEGIGVVLISHKLREVLSFASRVVVMRRGKKVAEVSPAQTTSAELAGLMVGEGRVPSPSTSPSATMSPQRAETPRPVLALARLCAPGLHDISLEVHPGEIVGVAGVDGNGQRELAEVVTGLRPFTQGRLLLSGVVVESLSPLDARRRGVAHIPEDRLARALIAELTVEENVALGRHRAPPCAKGRRIDFAGRRARTTELLEAHDVRPRQALIRAGALSGGNQQKLVVGRELDGQPKLLVAVQPTRGLDVAAVEAVRACLLAERRRGCGVLLVSLDLDEVMALADRLVVLYAGRVQATLARAEFDELAIGRHMLGVSHA